MLEHKKILIVDDDEKICMALKDTLQLKGFEVGSAQNGMQGLKQFQLEKPDLVITDISMPDMDGIEFVRELAKQKKRIPIIAMSGNPFGQNFLKAAMLFGAIEILQKPFTVIELLNKVNKILSL